MDEDGPYFEMNFALPKIKDSYGSTLRPGVYKTKVRPSDIQEYLEQTNRADEYRGGRKHMMDHFKDPSAMSHWTSFSKILVRGLLRWVSIKRSKRLGKTAVCYMAQAKSRGVYGEQRALQGGYLDLKEPIEHEVDSEEFKKEKKKEIRNCFPC